MRLMFALLSAFVAICNAQGSLRYHITDLGVIDNGSSEAHDINSYGEIVGGALSTSQHRAFYWNGSMISFSPGDGYSLATGINDAGTVVGLFSPLDHGHRAGKWVGGSFSYLPRLNNDPFSQALQINRSGVIVGLSGQSLSSSTACFWSGATVTSLGQLPGDMASTANDINDSGKMVGCSISQNYERYTAVTWSSGVIVALETLGGTYSKAYAVNSSGDVVGISSLAGDTESHATLWTSGSAIDLGTLGGLSRARAISDNGTVVGESDGRAFLWNGLMVDLNTLLHPDSSDWTLKAAYAINGSGQIVGYGNVLGRVHAFLATPDYSNHAPAANDATFSATEDTSCSITLTAADIDEDPLTYSIVTLPQNGTLTGTPPNMTYTPNQDFNGTDTFTFKANDGELDSNIATITINVSAVNDSPIATAPTTLATNQGSPLAFTLGVADVDAGGSRVRVNLVVSHGTLTLASTEGLIFNAGVADFTGTLTDVNAAMSNVTYRHTPGYFGPDTLTFTVNDQGFTGSGGPKSDAKSVPITIVQQSPITFGPSSYIVHEGFEFTGGLAGLMASDNQYLSVFSDDSSLGAQIEFIGASAYRVSSEVRFRLEHHVARAGIAYNVELYNYSTHSWEVGTGDVAPTSDSTFDVVVTTAATDFVDLYSGAVRGLVTWTPINDEDPAQDGWLHNVDLVSWRVKP